DAVEASSRSCQHSGRMGSAWPPVQTVLEISGFADVAALQRAVDTVFRAHPHLLRGFGRTAHGSLISVERRDAVPRLRAVDLREYPAGHREAAASRLEEHERCEEFALGAPPLVRLLLIRTGDRERRLAVTSHRLLLDDWSHAALIRSVPRISAWKRTRTAVSISLPRAAPRTRFG